MNRKIGPMSAVLLAGMLACSGAKAADVPKLEDLQKSRQQAVEQIRKLVDQVKQMDGAIYILQLQADAKKPDVKKADEKK